MSTNKLRLASICLVVVILAGTFRVQAQTAGRLHLTTSPLPISLKAKPGETIETELRVRNSGTSTETLKVGLMKFSAFGEEGKPRLQDRETGDDYFDWVTFSKMQLVAPPNEWQSIMMKISLPDTAAFGYYYAVTFSRAEDETAEGDLETAVRGGSATLVLLEADVPGAKRQMEIQDFSVGKRTYEFLPASFNLRLKNTGNIHTAPTGTLFITKGGKQMAAIPVNATKGNVLPDSSRNFTAEWTDGFPAYRAVEENEQVLLKDGKPVYNLRWDPNHSKSLRFGEYTATLVIAYDDGTRDIPMEASVSFWVIPWRLLIAGLFVAVFVGIGLWSTSRKVIDKLRKRRA